MKETVLRVAQRKSGTRGAARSRQGARVRRIVREKGVGDIKPVY